MKTKSLDAGVPAIPGKQRPLSEALSMDQLAEQEYASRFGKRPIHIHLLKRGIKFKNAHFLISPPFWWFVHRYPENIAFFYSVDLVLQKALFEGWGYFSEIKERAYQFTDGYMVSCDGFFPKRDLPALM